MLGAGSGAIADAGVQVPRRVGLVQRADLLARAGLERSGRSRGATTSPLRDRGGGQADLERPPAAPLPPQQPPLHDQEPGLLRRGQEARQPRHLRQVRSFPFRH